MSVRVTFIGTKGGPAYRAANSPNSTSTMISVGDNHYVVDCGLGSTKGILDGGVQLNNINAVVITHHHSDHNIEFGTLIHSAWVSGLNSTIQGYGPPGMHNLWRGTLISQTYDIETRIGDEGRPDLKKLVDIVEYGPGLLFDDGTVKVTAFRNVHPPVTDSFAIKFETKCGKVIVVSGDTAFMPELAEFSKGADLLVHEVRYGWAGPFIEGTNHRHLSIVLYFKYLYESYIDGHVPNAVSFLLILNPYRRCSYRAQKISRPTPIREEGTPPAC